MAGIAIPQGGIASLRRTLGSFSPHPANIGKIVGAARTGIAAGKMPKLHLARGGIAPDPENITQNMFSPVNSSSGVPNVDVNFITSPQLGVGKGAPAPASSQPEKQPDSMQQVAEGTSAANGLTSLYDKLPSTGGISSAIPSFLNPASAAENSALASSAVSDAGLSSIINGGGATAEAANVGAGVAGSTGFFDSLLALLPFADGGAVFPRAKGGSVGETMHVSGLLNSAGPGRTDTINTNVPAGAYVIPADVVSGLGEGNTLAGSAVID